MWCLQPHQELQKLSNGENLLCRKTRRWYTRRYYNGRFESDGDDDWFFPIIDHKPLFEFCEAFCCLSSKFALVCVYMAFFKAQINDCADEWKGKHINSFHNETANNEEFNKFNEKLLEMRPSELFNGHILRCATKCLGFF